MEWNEFWNDISLSLSNALSIVDHSFSIEQDFFHRISLTFWFDFSLFEFKKTQLAIVRVWNFVYRTVEDNWKLYSTQSSLFFFYSAFPENGRLELLFNLLSSGFTRMLRESNRNKGFLSDRSRFCVCRSNQIFDKEAKITVNSLDRYT